VGLNKEKTGLTFRSKSAPACLAADGARGRVQGSGQSGYAQGNGAVVCTKKELSALDQGTVIVPVWAI